MYFHGPPLACPKCTLLPAARGGGDGSRAGPHLPLNTSHAAMPCGAACAAPGARPGDATQPAGDVGGRGPPDGCCQSESNGLREASGSVQAALVPPGSGPQGRPPITGEGKTSSGDESAGRTSPFSWVTKFSPGKFSSAIWGASCSLCILLCASPVAAVARYWCSVVGSQSVCHARVQNQNASSCFDPTRAKVSHEFGVSRFPVSGGPAPTLEVCRNFLPPDEAAPGRSFPLACTVHRPMYRGRGASCPSPILHGGQEGRAGWD